MPIDLRHLPPPMPTAGTTTGFLDNFQASYRQQYVVDSMFGLGDELKKSFTENLNKFSEHTGEDLRSGAAFPETSQMAMEAAARRALEDDPYDTVLPPGVVEDYLKEIDRIDSRIEEERQKGFTDLMTFGEILEAVKKNRLEVMNEGDDVRGRQGLMGFMGSLAGGIAGSFTDRDPLLVGSMFVPLGAGRTLAQRLIAEVALGATAETAQQFLAVQPTQELLGEEGTDPFLSIAFAGIGAGVLRGGFEGAATGYRALQRRLFPREARTVQTQGVLETQLERPVRVPEGERPSDQIMLDTVRRLPPSPRRLQAEVGLAKDIAVERQSPFPNTRAGNIRAMEEVDQWFRGFEGAAPSETAIGRVLNGEAQELNLPDTVGELRARTENAEMFRRVDDLEDQYQEALRTRDQLRADLEKRRMADAVETLEEAQGISPTAAGRIREIEGEIASGVDATRRAKLEEELEFILQNAGPRQVEEAELRVREQMEEGIVTAEKNVRDIRKRLFPLRRETNKLIDESQPTRPQQPDLHPMDREQAVETPERLEGIIARMKVETEGGEIDVGGPRLVARDLEVPDSFEDGRVRTAAEVIEDIDDDEALRIAAKECGL